MQQDATRDEISFSFDVDENQKVFGVQYNTYKYFVKMIKIGFTLREGFLIWLPRIAGGVGNIKVLFGQL